MDCNPDAFKGLSINQIADVVVEIGLSMYDQAHEIDTATKETEKGYLTEAAKKTNEKYLDNEPRQEPDFPEDRFPPSEHYGEQP
jgi:hypothetical protein